MSRIWDALTVAQDEVTQKLASLSEPSTEEEPASGSSTEEGPSPILQAGACSAANEPFPLKDHFAARRQLSSPDLADEEMPAKQATLALSAGQEGWDDPQLESIFRPEAVPGPAVDETLRPGAAVVRSRQQDRMRRALLITAMLITIAAVIQIWRMRSAEMSLVPPPGWAAEEKPLPPAEVKTEVKMVVVGPNQTLAGISMLYLGEYNPAVLAKLRALNPGLRDPDHIVVGQQIRLPVVVGGEDSSGRSKPAGKPEGPK